MSGASAETLAGATMPPLEAFRFVEYAENGAANRNRVCPVADLPSVNGAKDVFATWLRYPDDLPAYLSTHRNGKGNPSIEGYDGPAYAPQTVFDFDCADDLARALQDARTFAIRLDQRFGLPPGAIQPFFSGFKGFSVEIPGQLFGGFEPMGRASELTGRLKALAEILCEGLETLDAGVYERVRLWRRPNTMHGQSGLFKVPLTTHELMTLGVPAIRSLATQPRSIERPPADDWDPIPDLVSVWREAIDAVGRRRSYRVDDTATRTFTDDQAALAVGIVAPHHELGQKHDLALCFGGYLGQEGFGEKQVLGMVEALAQNDKRPRDRSNGVRGTFARVRAGEPVRGYSGLRKLLPEPALASLERLVGEAEAQAVVGGREYRKAADGEPAAEAGEPSTDDPATSDAGILGPLRGRATNDPGSFARDALSEPATLGALARSARVSRGEYEAFLMELQGQGIKAKDIARIERSVNDALRRSRPKFRVVSADEATNAPRVKDALPEAPVTAEAVVPFGYRLGPDGVAEEHITEDGERRTIPLSPVPIVLAGRLIDIGDGEEHVRLAWTRDGRWREATVSRGVAANAREAVGLAGQGFPVTSRTAGDLVGYVAAYEAANIAHLPRARVSRQMGWQGRAGEQGFLWGRSLIRGDGEAVREINLDATPADEWESEWVAYHGPGDGADQLVDAFGQGGSFEGWLRAAELASRYPRVALAPYASLATALLEVLGAPNFGIDWSFQTSTGKTSTLRVAASCWGNPDEHAPASVVNTWDTTRVWIERAAEASNCLPLILDDTARAKQPKVVGQAIYDVIQGRGRGRGSPGGLRRSGTWATILLSSGEAPATTFTEDGGTRARMLCLWGPPFGRADETTARVVAEIDAAVRHNYGHAGPRIVRYLLQHRDRWSEWHDRYRAAEHLYIEHAGANPVAGRLARYFALLDASASLAHRALELPWEYREVVSALWDDLVHEASEADRSKAAMAMVMSWAHANAHTFEGRLDVDRDNIEKIPALGLSGKWDRSSNWESIAFYPHRIKELLEKAGQHPDAILRLWRDREWLETSGDRHRFTKAVRIQGEKTWALVVRRSATEEPAEDGA